MDNTTAWIAIGDFARQAGVSVRTLRFYEEQGLLSPLRDQRNGRRCFREDELIRLQNILLLKELGLSLTEIKRLLSATSPDLESVLGLQLDLLQGQKQALEETIQSVQQALTRLKAGYRPDLDALCQLIRMTRMRTQLSEQLYRKYLTTAQVEALSAKEATAATEENLKAWADLFEEASSLLNQDPKGAKVQEFAARWWTKLEESTGGDQELILNLKSMYDDMETWPEEIERPFPPEVRDLMNAAITHLLESRKP